MLFVMNSGEETFWASGCFADLDPRIAALPRDRQPDWAAAETFICDQSEQQLIDRWVWLEIDADTPAPHAARERLREHLQCVRGMVEAGSLAAIPYFVAGLVLFITDDTCELGKAIRVLSETGVLSAAGFEV